MLSVQSRLMLTMARILKKYVRKVFPKRDKPAFEAMLREFLVEVNDYPNNYHIYAECCFLVLQAIIRLVSYFSAGSYQCLVFWFNFSMIEIQTGIFNILWLKQMIVATLINHHLYIRPNMKMFMFIIHSIDRSFILKRFPTIHYNTGRLMKIFNTFYLVVRGSLSMGFILYITYAIPFHIHTTYMNLHQLSWFSILGFTMNAPGFWIAGSIVIRRLFIGITLVCFVIELFKYNNRVLFRSLRRQHLTPHEYYRCFVIYMSYFNAVNLVFGYTFFYLLILYTSFHVVASVWSIQNWNHIPFAIKFFIIILVFFEGQNYSVIHYLLTRASIQLHQPAGKILSGFLSNCPKNYGLRKHLSFAIIAEKIHTKKPMGYTYGTFGLVTMTSFVKYLLLYGNLMMKTYKFQCTHSEIDD